MRAGRAAPGGEQGSAEKWAHAAMALAVRALGHDGECAELDPARVLEIAERVLSEGDVREGSAVGNVAPADARALLRAWLVSVGLDEPLRGATWSPTCRTSASPTPTSTGAPRAPTSAGCARRSTTAMAPPSAARSVRSAPVLFTACIPAIPYAPSAAFISRERAKLARRDDELPRVAIVADGIGAMHGVTRTIEEIRERGVTAS